MTSVRVDEFDARDAGIGGRIGWSPLDLIGLEAELTYYPGDFPDENDRLGFSRRRVEGLFGVTIGPRLGRVRPFALARAGFLRYGEASGPVACIAIFPPPLDCVLAAGDTLPAYDAGAGVAVFPSRRTFVRLDVSDRIVRYPGPSFAQRRRHDGDFLSHELRIAIGAGVRFW